MLHNNPFHAFIKNFTKLYQMFFFFFVATTLIISLSNFKLFTKLQLTFKFNQRNNERIIPKSAKATGEKENFEWERIRTCSWFYVHEVISFQYFLPINAYQLCYTRKLVNNRWGVALHVVGVSWSYRFLCLLIIYDVMLFTRFNDIRARIMIKTG